MITYTLSDAFGLVKRDLAVKPLLPGAAAAKPGEFSDGPMVDVKGIFHIPAQRATATLQIPYALATTNQIHHAQVQWALDQVGTISTRLVGQAGGAQGQMAKVQKNGQWWGTGANYTMLPLLEQYPSRVWKGLAIGAEQLWWEKLVGGEKPIARFEHPTFKETYGVFLTIDGGYFTFTFKEAPKSWLGSLWDWITDLPARLIELAGDFLGALKDLACPIARNNLDELAMLASGTIGLNAASIQAILSSGVVSEQQLDTLASRPTQDVVKNIGNQVINRICGPASTTPTATPTTGKAGAGTVIAVGVGVAAVGGLLWYLLR